MKKIILALLVSTIGMSCSKDDGPTVTVSYIVESGNPDGVLLVRQQDETSYKEVAYGAEINYSTTYNRDGTNVIMMWYRTGSPAKDGFYMSISYDGRSFSNHYLSDQFSRYHYEVDLPHKL